MDGLTKSKWLLNPLDRAGEVLFGLIMALSFTCTISIANTQLTEVRQLLIGAVGCNLAWGLVDATMYLVGVLTQKSRNRLINQPQTAGDVRITRQDVTQAIALFLIMAISTLPVVAPFAFIHDTKVALRISNGIAIIMMFLCGWSVATYVGYNKWKMSIAMVLIGIMMVAITIMLGG